MRPNKYNYNGFHEFVKMFVRQLTIGLRRLTKSPRIG